MAEDTEQVPKWAVELIAQVAVLNEKLPTHVDWVERNIKDHEQRIRTVEIEKTSTAVTGDLARRIDILESNQDKSQWARNLGLIGGTAAVTGLVSWLIGGVLPNL